MNSWVRTYLFPGLGYLVGFIGVLYSARATKTREIRKIRQDTLIDYLNSMTTGARLGMDFNEKLIVDEKLTEKQITTLVIEEHARREKVRFQFNQWNAESDEFLFKFMLFAPNYVANAGGDFRISILRFFDGKEVFRHYQYYWQEFQIEARFDLQHPILSFIRSFFYFLKLLIKRTIYISWHLIPFHHKLGKSFKGIVLVKYIQNIRNANFEILWILDEDFEYSYELVQQDSHLHFFNLHALEMLFPFLKKFNRKLATEIPSQA